METLIVRYPPGCEAILMQTLGELSKVGVSVEKSSAGEGFDDIEELADEKFERIPGLPYTHEERVASVRRSMAHYRATGEAITTEELAKRMATW